MWRALLASRRTADSQLVACFGSHLFRHALSSQLLRLHAARWSIAQLRAASQQQYGASQPPPPRGFASQAQAEEAFGGGRPRRAGGLSRQEAAALLQQQAAARAEAEQARAAGRGGGASSSGDKGKPRSRLSRVDELLSAFQRPAAAARGGGAALADDSYAPGSVFEDERPGASDEDEEEEEAAGGRGGRGRRGKRGSSGAAKGVPHWQSGRRSGLLRGLDMDGGDSLAGQGMKATAEAAAAAGKGRPVAERRQRSGAGAATAAAQQLALEAARQLTRQLEQADSIASLEHVWQGNGKALGYIHVAALAHQLMHIYRAELRDPLFRADGDKQAAFRDAAAALLQRAASHLLQLAARQAATDDDDAQGGSAADSRSARGGATAAAAAPAAAAPNDAYSSYYGGDLELPDQGVYPASSDEEEEMGRQALRAERGKVKGPVTLHVAAAAVLNAADRIGRAHRLHGLQPALVRALLQHQRQLAGLAPRQLAALATGLTALQQPRASPAASAAEAPAAAAEGGGGQPAAGGARGPRPAPPLTQLWAALAAALQASMDSLEPRSVAAIVNALAAAQPQLPDLDALYAGLASQALATLHRYRADDLADLAFGYAQAGLHNKTLFDAIFKAVRQLGGGGGKSKQEGAATAKDLVKLATACNMLGCPAPPPFLRLLHAVAARQAQTLEPRLLARLTHVLMQLGGYDREAFGILAKAAGNLAPSMGPEDLVHVAVAYHAVEHPKPALMGAVGAALLARLQGKQQGNQLAAGQDVVSQPLQQPWQAGGPAAWLGPVQAAQLLLAYSKRGVSDNAEHVFEAVLGSWLVGVERRPSRCDLRHWRSLYAVVAASDHARPGTMDRIAAVLTQLLGRLRQEAQQHAEAARQAQRGPGLEAAEAAAAGSAFLGDGSGGGSAAAARPLRRPLLMTQPNNAPRHLAALLEALATARHHHRELLLEALHLLSRAAVRLDPEGPENGPQIGSGSGNDNSSGWRPRHTVKALQALARLTPLAGGPLTKADGTALYWSLFKLINAAAPHVSQLSAADAVTCLSSLAQLHMRDRQMYIPFFAHIKGLLTAHIKDLAAAAAAEGGEGLDALGAGAAAAAAVRAVLAPADAARLVEAQHYVTQLLPELEVTQKVKLGEFFSPLLDAASSHVRQLPPSLAQQQVCAALEALGLQASVNGPAHAGRQLHADLMVADALGQTFAIELHNPSDLSAYGQAGLLLNPKAARQQQLEQLCVHVVTIALDAWARLPDAVSQEYYIRGKMAVAGAQLS